MALVVTWEDILNVANDGDRAEFEEFTQSQINMILEHVRVRISDTVFLTAAKTVQAHMGAHVASLAITASAGEGTLSSVSIGGISTGFTMAVNNPDAKNRLLSTHYGGTVFEYQRMFAPAIYN